MIFQGKSNLQFSAHRSIGLAAEIWASQPENIRPSRQQILVTWEKPQQQWFKLNTDGSVLNNANASAGGVIRDHHGNWVSGFSTNIGLASVPEAETWTVFHEIRQALSLNIAFLEIDVDAQFLVQLPQDGNKAPAQSTKIVDNCRSMLWLLQGFKITSIYREANRVADRLAKHGRNVLPHFVVFIDPPDFILQLLNFDAAHHELPRLV